MSFALEFELGSCLFTEHNEDGFPKAQFDADGIEGGQFEPVDLHHAFGFAARPRDPEVDSDGNPTEGGSCNMLYAAEGDTMHSWLAFDPRYIPNIPKLKKGGSSQYGGDPERPTFAVIDGDDGTLTIYAPIPGQQKAHVITAGVDANGAPTLSLAHADGMAMTMFNGKVVIKNADGSAYNELGPAGHVLSGSSLFKGGAVFGNPEAAQPLVTAGGLAAVIAELKVQLVAAFGGAAGATNVAALSAPLTSLSAAATTLTKAS